MTFPIEWASLHRRIASGDAGWACAPIAAALLAAARVYGWAVAARNRYHDWRGPAERLAVPVISVGNLTAGGTGKTPMVIHLVRRLTQGGLRPAVVSRGYRAGPDGLNDEHRLIARDCPQAVCVCDADRARGGRRAAELKGADVVLLDDGFQHRRLHRDLDIVLIDATCPFGYDRLLPLGTLREPPASLRRSDVIVLTRADQVDARAAAEIERRIRRHAPDATVLRSRHRVERVATLHGEADETPLAGRRVVCFAAIGNPAAFEGTVRDLGADVVGRRWWPDHHPYLPCDAADLLRDGRFPPFNDLVTTEKDAVKLSSLHRPDDAVAKRIRVVRVRIDFDGDGDTMMSDLLSAVLKGRRSPRRPLQAAD